MNQNFKKQNFNTNSLFVVCLAVFFNIGGGIIPETKAQEPIAQNGHFVTVNGLKLYYEESGTGTPLLLLHGFGRTASDWNGYTTEFSKSYRVIAMDLPGHGRSDYMDTTNAYLHKRAAEYILGALEALHIDSVYVLGHSSGGFVTLYMATLRPEIVKKIIVVSGQVYYSSKTRKEITSLGEPGKNPFFKPEDLAKLHGELKGNILAQQFWNFRKLYGDPSFTPDVLSTIKARAFIIHGDDDPIAPVTNAWEMFQNIPRAHLWIVPGGGHVPQLGIERQKDFIREVMAFLSEN